MPTTFLNLFSSRRSYNHERAFTRYLSGPLLEQLSYKAAMRVLNVLDTLRSVVRRELSVTPGTNAMSLRVYWQLVHALGQLVLLASNRDSRPWLTDMANSFVWETWTP